MTQQGKKYLAALATVDRSKAYAPLEALRLAREGSITKFDGTMEVHIRLAVDPRQADQQVRATVLLPRGLGKTVRILVFADGDGARLARDAGADFIADDELIKKIQEVGRGEAAADPTTTSRMFARMREMARKREESAFSQLTEQELRVLALLAEGKTNREIADTLVLGEGTVRNYVSSVFSKLHVNNRAEAAAYAAAHNIRDYM